LNFLFLSNDLPHILLKRFFLKRFFLYIESGDDDSLLDILADNSRSSRYSSASIFNPSKSEPPPRTEPVKTELPRPETAKTESVKTELPPRPDTAAKTESSKFDLSKSEAPAFSGGYMPSAVEG
jgi:hypothetical protein